MKVTVKFAVVLCFLGFLVVQGCGPSQESDRFFSDATPEIREDGTQIYQGSGVVRGIDKNVKEIAIEHGEIKGLMSAMTMDFKVGDPAMLEEVAPGDNVDFELERKGSDLTLTKILKKGAAASSEGARIFKSNCAECHGENGQGTDKGISLLKGHALDHPREDFIKQVREGEKDEMPSFSDKLSEKEIESVVDYVRNVIQKDAKKEGSGSHDH